MNISEYQTSQLLINQPTFNKFSFTLLINRLRRTYKEAPTANELTECTNEINAFLQKYYLAMAKDYAYIIEAYQPCETYHKPLAA